MINIDTNFAAVMERMLADEQRDEVRHQAAMKAWVTRRANARRRDYQARGVKSWITRRANTYFGTEEQSSVTRRLNELY